MHNFQKYLSPSSTYGGRPNSAPNPNPYPNQEQKRGRNTRETRRCCFYIDLRTFIELYQYIIEQKKKYTHSSCVIKDLVETHFSLQAACGMYPDCVYY